MCVCVHVRTTCMCVFSVIKYRVSVVTGDVENAETKADIYIELHGHMGSTGKRHLRKSLTNSKMFQRNQVLASIWDK